jgi:NAD-dependent dihydropyrimidine dehydrogenase PreA subunit
MSVVKDQWSTRKRRPYVKDPAMCRLCRHATEFRCPMSLGSEKVVACIGYFPYLKAV